MKVITLHAPPSTTELAKVLQKEFSDHCSYRFFGLGKKKSLIIQKSSFVGAQVSVQDAQVTIQGMHPSLMGNFMHFIDGLVTGGILLELPFFSKWKKFEKEVAVFLKHKYGR